MIVAHEKSDEIHILNEL